MATATAAAGRLAGRPRDVLAVGPLLLAAGAALALALVGGARAANAAEEPMLSSEGAPEGDALFFDTCEACVGAGKAWTPSLGGCDEGCFVQDVSCYTMPGTCPQTQEFCGDVWSVAKFEAGASEAMCDMCVSSGCVYQEGECRAECSFGPLGDFQATCYQAEAPAPACAELGGSSDTAATEEFCAGVWAAATFMVGDFRGMCNMCVANGCVYQEGNCRAECVAGPTCYTRADPPAPSCSELPHPGSGAASPAPAPHPAPSS